MKLEEDASIIFDLSACLTTWWAVLALPTNPCPPAIPQTTPISPCIHPPITPSPSSTSLATRPILSMLMEFPMMLLSVKWAVLPLQPRCFSSLPRVPVHSFDQKIHHEWQIVSPLFCRFRERPPVDHRPQHPPRLPLWQTRQTRTQDLLRQRFQGS